MRCGQRRRPEHAAHHVGMERMSRPIGKQLTMASVLRLLRLPRWLSSKIHCFASSFPPGEFIGHWCERRALRTRTDGGREGGRVQRRLTSWPPCRQRLHGGPFSASVHLIYV